MEKFQGNRFKLNIWRLCLQISCPKIENLTYKVTHIPISHKSLGREESFSFPFIPLQAPNLPPSPGPGPKSNSLVSLTRPTLDLYTQCIYFCHDSSHKTTIISHLEYWGSPSTGIASQMEYLPNRKSLPNRLLTGITPSLDWSPNWNSLPIIRITCNEGGCLQCRRCGFITWVGKIP